jgi:hypothetical protein
MNLINVNPFGESATLTQLSQYDSNTTVALLSGGFIVVGGLEGCGAGGVLPTKKEKFIGCWRRKGRGGRNDLVGGGFVGAGRGFESVHSQMSSGQKGRLKLKFHVASFDSSAGLLSQQRPCRQCR